MFMKFQRHQQQQHHIKSINCRLVALIACILKRIDCYFSKNRQKSFSFYFKIRKWQFYS